MLGSMKTTRNNRTKSRHDLSRALILMLGAISLATAGCSASSAKTQKFTVTEKKAMTTKTAQPTDAKQATSRMNLGKPTGKVNSPWSTPK